MRWAGLLFGAACSVAMAGTGHANLITNGSFEAPVVAVGGFTNFNVGSNGITGFTVVGPTNTNVSIISGTFSQNGVTFEAEDGVQWLDLTGDGANSTEGVSQSVATTSGHKYQLSDFIGNTTGGGIFGTTSTVNVSLNGVPTFSHTNSAVNNTGLTWEQFTDTFVATGSSTTINFLNGDPAGDNSNGLDNIVLVDLGPATTPAPEPASVMLLASGLAGFGLMRRRRKD